MIGGGGPGGRLKSGAGQADRGLAPATNNGARIANSLLSDRGPEPDGLATGPTPGVFEPGG